MRRAYLQAVGGVAGDMLLAAVISAGAPEAELANFLAGLPGRLILQTEHVTVSGLSALRVKLSAAEPGGLPSRFSAFMEMVEGLAIEETLKARAREIFQVIFQAEARVHGRSLSEVHLHELSAYDTLGDVLGVLYGLQLLRVSELYVSPLPLGSGLIETAHGTLPLPAPATLEILREIPVYGIPESFETVTPTGAALVKVLARGFGKMPSMEIEAVGTGAGSSVFETRPNVVRLLVGRVPEVEVAEEVWEIVTDLDDESPEVLGYLMERLLSAGALDVGFLPRFMKKGRPGVRLEVLSQPEKLEALARLVLEETGTLGVRLRRVERRTLRREIRTVKTPWGTVRVKVARSPEGGLKLKPEYEDLRKIARKSGLPLRRVREEVQTLFSELKWERNK